MKVVLVPYFSQQDKRTGKLSLSTDSACKFFARLAEALGAVVVAPQPEQRADSFSFANESVLRERVSLSNRDRRFQTLPFVDAIPSDATHVITTHEALAYTLKALRPGVKVAMECGFDPAVAWPETSELIRLSWRAADLVFCASEPLRGLVEAPTALWRFAYDGSVAKPRKLARDIGCLFNSRCSATGYSNHELFLSATEGMSRAMTDPTRYLSDAEPLSQEGYEALLHRSKLVVGLMRSGHTGFSFIEAIAAGCCPVALRTPAYEALLGAAWPYLCEASELRQTLERALRLGWQGASSQLVRRLQVEVDSCSYAATISEVKRWLAS